jgi:hypothetical protein
LFEYVLNKLLPESAKSQQQQYYHRRQLLAMTKFRKFSEKDRYGLDRVLVFVLELFTHDHSELRDELFDVVLKKLVHPEISICLDDFQAKYPKTWNYVTDKGDGQHASLNEAIAKVFAVLPCNALAEQKASDSIIELIDASESQILLEARTQQLCNLPDYIEYLFTKLISTTNNGFRRAYLTAINWSTKKYLVQGKFLFFDNEDLILSQFRRKFEACLTKLDDWPLNLRSLLLDVLLVFGFTLSDKVMFEVMFNSTSSSSATVDRVQWLNKVSRLLNDEIEIKKRK